ncbi:MAG: TIGR00282 family metallophosphoesterase [bacterium]|nr:TIGR00282 family metallophosphoesterase [bacterium]
MKLINILCLGDVVGKPGRECLENNLKNIQDKHNIDFTVCNIENAAGGFGFTRNTYIDLKNININAFTSGNHVYQQKSVLQDFSYFKSLVRPLNFPSDNPGAGYRIFNLNTIKIGVVNLIGRVFLGEYDCPFHCIKNHIHQIKKETPIILVDFHAEATSEKEAMGWFLDGEVSLIYGTHTHVMTADERILHKSTAYITDIGMTGARNSILGMKKEPVIKKFLTQMPSRFEIPKDDECIFNGIKCVIETETGKAVCIERIFEVFN